ncbi:MAG: DUF255 domain-containing protein [Bacteroidota bacterium]
MQKSKLLLVLLPFYSLGQISFDTLGWNQALEKAQANNKSIFVHAYSEWCEPCQSMEVYIYTDQEVGDFYNQHFVNLKLDLENYPGVFLAEKYRLGIYPGYLFVQSDGSVLHRGCGSMDASEFLLMGETALDPKKNLAFFNRTFNNDNRDTDFVMNYLEVIEAGCLDPEQAASSILTGIPTEELASDFAWNLIASYNWDVYSREFKYLLSNPKVFEAKHGKAAVQTKIYDTFMAQYQEVYESEELHTFGMRSLMEAIDQADFQGADTLKIMMQLHLAEYTENWAEYGDYAIEYMSVINVVDPYELADLAWKFYLFVEDPAKLKKAIIWAKTAVDKEPAPLIIDTLASLYFKLGNKKKAIELESRALELAKGMYEDVEHYKYQLYTFEN